MCPPFHSYYPMYGFCNNLQNPKLGATSTPYSRLYGPLYDDDIWTIRKSVTGNDLPSVRLLANELLEQSTYVSKPMNVSNAISFNYGMFIAHDAGKMTMYQRGRCYRKRITIYCGNHSF